MEPFRLVVKPGEYDPATVEAALRRAWNACAAVACPKCRAKPGEYCRNRNGSIWFVAQFHKPRQEAANTLAITRPVGIGGLSWAKCTGRITWSAQRIPTM
ncbi:hypothetical protein [Streptomyces sp. NPDC058254]|uniref:zinc finger domain-containing protein n=1 Tax=Streptomyces sp. NPDC058254 TaxID=3346406 RepID=UPI0036EE6926